jgi:hypothetical protein
LDQTKRKRSRLKGIVLLRGKGIVYEMGEFEFERKLNGYVSGENPEYRVNTQAFLLVCAET